MFTKIYFFSKKTIIYSLLFSFLFVFSACSNKPINYYLLEMPQEIPNSIQNTQSLEAKNQEQSALSSIPTNINLSGPIIALSQVILPQYLNRPQIITRNNIDFSINDDNRWGEELSSGIARVLCMSLSKNLVKIGATSSPLRIGLSPDYVINLEINSFEGTLDGNLRLRTLWTLDTSSRNKNHKNTENSYNSSNLWQAFFDQTIPSGNSYADYVEAYSVLVDALGAEIARVFEDIYNKAHKFHK